MRGKKILVIIFLVLAVLAFVFYGAKVYKNKIANRKSIVNLIKSEKIEFKNNNIYKDGVKGIIADLACEFVLPKELYMVNGFDLKYKKDGTITNLDTFLYGKDKNNKIRTYLITYDEKKSKYIEVYKDGYAGETYNENKIFKPLIDTTSVIDFKGISNSSNANTFKISYFGKKDFGSNKELEAKKPKIKGEIKYRLDITGAAAGSRSFSLSKSIDGGQTFNIINEDPFNGELGESSEVKFLDDNFGFVTLTHNGGRDSDIYITVDSGKTFKKISYKKKKVILKNGEYIEPFDFPSLIEKKSGNLEMLVGQGSDGDYNNNSKAIYTSKDNGVTWNYTKEIN